MKIAYTGTQGTGKTHAAIERAAKLKRENPDKEVGLLINVERECPLPINRETTFESQMWIFTTQIREEIRLANIYDILVTDKTAMDMVAYIGAFCSGGYWKTGYSPMYMTARRWLRTYDRIIFRTLYSNEYCMDDGIRCVDESARKSVEEALIRLYNTCLGPMDPSDDKFTVQ